MSVPESGIEEARSVFKQLYKEPKVFKAKDYAPLKHQFTIARKELAAYAYLCRQQEAREWLEYVLNETFPENPEPDQTDELMKRSYKTDLFPPLRSGVHLCNMLNKVVPGSISKVEKAEGRPFLMLENINFFLKALKQLGLPEHKLFSPLDLLERKNMPRVVYCIHQFAALAVEKYGIGRKIGDRTDKSAYKFDEEELAKAGKDLEESDAQASNDKRVLVKKQSTLHITPTTTQEDLRKALAEENYQHNMQQILRNRRNYVLDQYEPAEVIIEGLSKAENVTGHPDENYALCADITFQDGSTDNKKFVSFNTGDHDWEQRIINLSYDKAIKEVYVYPEFEEHTGKVWFDKFGCFENRPPTNLIQFVQNESFETLENDKVFDGLVKYWDPEGQGYRQDSKNSYAGGFSIAVEGKGAKAGAVNHVTIYQTEPAALIIEGRSKAEDVVLGEDKDARYSIVGEIIFDDDSREEVSIDFTEGSHDWEKKTFNIEPRSKPVKAINLHAVFNGQSGTAYFDGFTVCQEECKQYVKNPSFETLTNLVQIDQSKAKYWDSVGNHYAMNQKEWIGYGHTSVKLQSDSNNKECIIEQKVELNQKRAKELRIEGWSKCVDVSGEKGDHYSLSADITFMDGSKEKVIQSAAFNVGSHDWEKVEMNYTPEKPVKEILLRAQLKERSGEAYFDNLTISEEYEFGESEVFIIQKLLKALEDDKDGIDEIAELKRRLLVELRKNNKMEKELSSIEKRIGLLVKNRIDVMELVQAQKYFFKIFKRRQQLRGTGPSTGHTIDHIKKKMNLYQNLFYLLQTEPKYLAKIVTLVSPTDMDDFMETVILTLFGDDFSPREEFLLLQLLNQATENEMSSFKDVAGFLEANTVTAKMIVTYNRRTLGQEYLIKTLAPVLQQFIQTKDLDLETSPLKAYNAMITEEEMLSGQKSKRVRVNSDEEAMALPEVKQLIDTRIQTLKDTASRFLDVILCTIDALPYGLRWICKRIVEIGTSQFDLKDVQMHKTIGYFVYYRFLNPAIVSPDLYGIIRLNLNTLQRKNLVQVSKVLQTLFNFSNFSGEKQTLVGLNSWMNSTMPSLTNYLSKLISVGEPQDMLMVDQYMELTTGTKPVILMTYDEIYSTHEILVKNKNSIATDSNDPLVAVLSSLGNLPEYDLSDDDMNREVQLTLQNPRPDEAASHKLTAVEEISLPAQTRQAFMQLLIHLENDCTASSLHEVYTHYIKHPSKNETTQKFIKEIERNLNDLEKSTGKDKATICGNMMDEISKYVADKAKRKIQRNNIITRLKLALSNLYKNQKFMEEQMEQYQTYLDVARVQTAGKGQKNLKKQSKGKKFSYSELKKAGIIVDSSVPEKTRKATSFTISRSAENPNEFQVKAKIAGITADTAKLEFDELLEKQSQGTPVLELEHITLDVNMTVSFINRNFQQKV